MKALHDETKPEIRKAHHWIPISISVFALLVALVSLFISWKQSAPMVRVVPDSDTDDPLVGLQIGNYGSTVARIDKVTYYVDRKRMDDVEDVADAGKLVDVGEYEFGDDGVLAVGDRQWLLSKKTKGNAKDIEHFNDFVANHLAVEVTACSNVTRECDTRCSQTDWCK